MRHQAQEEQTTQLLLKKAASYAELEENARIALSVLQDDGWKVARIGVDMRVQVFAEPVIQEHNPAAAALDEAHAKFILVREKLIESNLYQWLSMMLAFLISAAMHWFGIGAWIIVLAPVSLGCYAIGKKLSQKKGAA